MADQQTRGGQQPDADKKRDTDRQQQNQAPDANQPGGGQPRKDDPSLAPESGDRKATG